MTQMVLPLLLLLTVLNAVTGDDHQILLTVKSSIDDPLGSLSSWSPSTSVCQWHGVTCMSHPTSPPQVTHLLLSNRNLSGILPTSLFSLPSLQVLDLSRNSLHGNLTFPVTPTLRHVNLCDNNLSGSIALQSDGWNGLITLDLSNNFFSGGIPEKLGRLFYIKTLDLGGNCLQGPIPGSIFAGLRSIEKLTLASNRLSGRIPPEIGKVTTLQWLYFGYNNLSGEIPPQIGNLTALEHLDLVYNNLRGEIPESLGNLRRLRHIYLYMNGLSGIIPPSIYDLSDLVSLDLSFNDLSGPISDKILQMDNLEILHLFSNRLDGKIPSAISHLRRLRVLQLWDNRLSGSLPMDLGLRSDLSVVDISTNNLTGVIPEHLCRSGKLYKLILFSNHLYGRIPQSLGRCKSLARIRIQKNQLMGGIPVEFSRLPSVYYLDVSSNKLTGRIDDRVWKMGSLQMVSLADNGFEGGLGGSFGSEKLQFIDLSGNRFSGGIPSGFFRLIHLERLNLAGNRLQGPIPSEVSHCRKLVEFDVSRNRLTGEIPQGLCDLPVLSHLDLSENMFTGKVPAELGRSGSLVYVNISHNDLYGKLPETDAFLVANLTAISGNGGLCSDRSIGNGIPPCRMQSPLWHWREGAIGVVSAALLLLLLSAILLLLIRRRKRHARIVQGNSNGSWEVCVFEGSEPSTDGVLLELLKDGNVVSDGCNCNTWLVAKEVSVEDARFGWRELHKLGRLRHSNVASLVRVYKSERRWVLMYAHVEGRGLGGDGVLEGLDWVRRWRVAVAVASGMRELHRRGIVTGLRKGCLFNHVVLGWSDVPRLLVDVYASSDASGRTDELTEKSDVFSFGVLLIQLLTGRRLSRDDESGSSIELVGWARYSYSTCNIEKLMDPAVKAQVVRDGLEYQIIAVMAVALRCTADAPGDRPLMSLVARGLEAIIEEGRASCASRLLK